MMGILALFMKALECVWGLGRDAWIFLWSCFRSRSSAAANIVALESQLDVYLRRRHPRNPSGNWLTFIRNHLEVSWAMGWYEHARPHQGLGGECPVPGKREKLEEGEGKIVSIPVLGGLHHRYERIAA
jgi:hypothetical protein